MNNIDLGLAGKGRGEISAVVTKADGTVVDIGVITSPYNDKFRNWVWKKFDARRVRKLLGR